MNDGGRPLKRWASTALVLALVTAMVIHVARSGEELASIRRLSLGVLGLTCALQFGAQLFLNASMLLPLRTCMRQLGFWELYAVRMGGFLVGGLVPVAGGVAVRLAYLRRLGISYQDFTWATLLSNVLGLTAAGVVTLFATVSLWTLSGRPPDAVLAVAAAVLGACIAALLIFDAIPRMSGRGLLRRWAWLSRMPGWRTYPALSASVFGHSLGRHLLNFATFALLTRALAQAPGDFLAGGLVYALTSPLRMINITPGNLGVMEWVTALVGNALAFDLTTWFVAALAFRAIGLVAQALGMVAGSAWIARMKEDRNGTA